VDRLEEMGGQLGGILEQHDLFADRIEDLSQKVGSLETLTEEHDEALGGLGENVEDMDDRLKSKIDFVSSTLQEKIHSLQGMVEVEFEDMKVLSEEKTRTLQKQVDEIQEAQMDTGFNVSDDQKQAMEQELADVLSEVCATFETLAEKQKRIPPMPTSLLENIVKSAQDISRAIADIANYDAIKRTVRSSLDDTMYAEDQVSVFRTEEVASFERKVMKKVEHLNPKPSQYKRDARQKFITVLDQAIEVSLTQFEQVVVMGHSRIGRVALPTCVACDRPLVEKVRKSSSNTNLRRKLGRPDTDLGSQYDQISGLVNNSYFMHGNEVDGGSEEEGEQSRGPLMLPFMKGQQQDNTLLSKSMPSLHAQSTKEGKTILRGGFRMPVPVPSSEVIDMIDEGQERRDGLGSRFVESAKLPTMFERK
jgi:hypothetical protein